MKHKILIIVSTVIVFVLTSVLAAIWLLKIRYIEVGVVAESSYEQETHDKVNSLIESKYNGYFFFAVSEEEITSMLTEDPYIKVLSVAKVFPDRIKISVERRKERFAISLNGGYYITDDEYHLLRKETDLEKVGDGVIKISVKDVEVKDESLIIGQKIGYGSDNLVGYTTSIFQGFSDGLNLIESVEVLGRQNWIWFKTKTGVIIEYSFAPSSPNASEEVIKRETTALVNKAPEVEIFYENLSESQKSGGYLLVGTNAKGQITIDYVAEKASA